MKKLKVVVWLLVFGLLALVIFENEEFFLNTQQSLRLNLWRLVDYQSPSLPLAVYYILFFVFGLVVAFGFSAATRFKLRRTVKRLTGTVAGREKEILSLKTELAQLKGEPLPGPSESSITSPIKPA
ncbi:MAG: lipopolysaccharide assembly protein LapA domain-containing protein [Hyphomicrobiales bacterium]